MESIDDFLIIPPKVLSQEQLEATIQYSFWDLWRECYKVAQGKETPGTVVSVTISTEEANATATNTGFSFQPREWGIIQDGATVCLKAAEQVIDYMGWWLTSLAVPCVKRTPHLLEVSPADFVYRVPLE